jgi:ABC-type branched-subunit amino acid transport system substrate-binding protein
VGDDSLQTQRVLDKPEISKMHLIIGPFFPKSLRMVAKYAQKYNINVVDPLTSDSTTVKKYSNVFKANPMYSTQVQLLAQFLVDNYKDETIIVVHNNTDAELSTLKNLRIGFKDAYSKIGKDESAYKEVIYSQGGMGGITKLFVPGKKNIVVTLMSGEIFVTSYLTAFNEVADKNDVILVGMPAWKNYENIEIEYFVNLYVHMFSNSFVDYESDKVKNFLKAYRAKYEADCDKYAFMGFDITYYFLTALQKYGKDFQDCISNVKTEPLQTSYNFKKLGDKSGYENMFVNVYRFDDYKLVDARKPIEKKKKKKN